MMDGRVKTLHPKGARRACCTCAAMPSMRPPCEEHGIEPIDLLVVNLYPFEATVAKPDVTLADAIENIDIGGPSMLRSAAKNHESVTVIVDPSDYKVVAEQIQSAGGTTLELRRTLAVKVYARTAEYDAAIAAHLQTAFGVGSTEEASEELPAELMVQASLGTNIALRRKPPPTCRLVRQVR